MSRGVPLAARDAAAAVPAQLQHLLAERDTIRLDGLADPEAHAEIARALLEIDQQLAAARNVLAVHGTHATRAGTTPRISKWRTARALSGIWVSLLLVAT